MNNRIWVLISFLVGLVLFSGNCFADSECFEENGLVYCNDVTSYTDTNGNVFTGIGTITISGGSESITILDRNLGATTNDISKTGSYGYYFQWGTGSSINTGYKGDWDNLCPEGYKIPTSGDLSKLNSIILGSSNCKNGSNTGKCVSNLLHIPFASSYTDTGKFLNDMAGRYRTSTFNSKKDSFYWSIITSEIRLNNKIASNNLGFSIRCFANEPHQFVTLSFSGTNSEIQNQLLISGTKAQSPDEPEMSGSQFSGWYLTGMKTKWDFETDVVTGNITLYAKWIDENEEETESENKTEKKQDEKSIEGKDIEVSLDSGLILYYTFDGDSVSGNNVYDQSNSHNTGTANSGVKFNSGNNYGSVEFNGTGFIDFIDFGLNGKINQTLSIRVKTDNKNSQIIFGTPYSVGLGFHEGSHLIGFSSNKSAGKNKGIVGESYYNKERNHIVVIVSGLEISYYINGIELTNSETNTHYRDKFGTGGRIGARGDGTTSFSGYLDEVRVYNRAISKDEVVELYKEGFNPGEIGCNVEYSRNEENSGYIDATLICSDGVTIKGESSHTFKESGEYIFEYDYGWNTGTTIATVKSYNIKFKAGDNGTLSGVTEYSGLLLDEKSNLKSLGIIEPQTIANSGFEFYKWDKKETEISQKKLFASKNTNTSLENITISSDMTFIAQFKEAESTGTTEEINSGDNQIINTGSKRKKKSTTTVENNETNTHNASIVYDDTLSQELNDAYKFAYENRITTMDSIGKANMLGGMDRISMAKMLSQYAINILGKEPADIEVPNFTDISEDLDAQYLSGVTLAYQLGIMGINMPNNEFRPFDLVPRAEFGTALSRMLYKLADGNDIYYSTHLNKLKSEGILKDINPSLLELRGWGMLMLMRSSSK